MRFFAAFVILFLHAAQFLSLDIIFYMRSWAPLAVDFFFVLSGFILTYTYHDQWKSKRFDYRGFLIKRLARIYPVYFLTLICVVVILFIISMRSTFNADYTIIDVGVLPHLFMVQAWLGTSPTDYNIVSWSVSAEFFAYLLFVRFLMVLKEDTPVFNFILSLFVFYMTYFGAQYFVGRPSVRMIELSIIRIVPEFALGVSTYFLFSRYQVTSYLGRHIIFCYTALCVSVILQLGNLFAVPLFCYLVFLYADKSRRNEPTFLDLPILQYLGRVSYSLYMVHYIVWLFIVCLLVFIFDFSSFKILDDYLQHGISTEVRCVFMFIYMVCSVFAAMMMYHLCEVPGRRFINSYARRFIE